MRARRTVVANIISRGLAFVTFVLVSRIALADLGELRFGIWMTISSLLLLLTFLDLGVGNGLVSPIARAYVPGNSESVADIITRGLAVTGLIGVLISTAAICASILAPIELLFPGVDAVTLKEARTALICFSILIGLSPPLGAIGRIFVGMQRGYIPHFANILGSGATIILIWLIGSIGGVSITGYVLMTFGFTQVSAALTAFVLMRERHVRLSFLWNASWRDYRALLSTGGLFFALQLTVMIGWGLDQSFISALAGPAAVAGFAVAGRIFLLVSQPFAIWNAPLWSAYADAINANDHQFVRQALRRSLIGTALGASIGVALILAAGPLVWKLFTADKLEYDGLLMVSFGVWTICEAVGSAFAMYLNGAHIVRQQLIAMCGFLILVLPVKLLVIENIGVSFAPLATALCYSIALGTAYGLVFRRSLSLAFRADPSARPAGSIQS